MGVETGLLNTAIRRPITAATVYEGGRQRTVGLGYETGANG